MNIVFRIFFPLLLFLLSQGCGLTIPNLPIPSAEEKPINIYQGEITSISEPIFITHKCCSKVNINMEVNQKSDSGSFNAFATVKAYGTIKEKDTKHLVLDMIFDDYRTNISHFNKNDSLSCHIIYRKNSSRHNVMDIENISLSPSSEKYAYLKEESFIIALRGDIFGWMRWMFYLPNQRIKTGDLLNLFEMTIVPTGREALYSPKMVRNDSRVNGVTLYKEREHIVFSIDFSVEQEGTGYSWTIAQNPYKLYIVGYILIDKETGLHSIGSFKNRFLVRHHTKTEKYWIDYNFTMEQTTHIE